MLSCMARKTAQPTMPTCCTGLHGQASHCGCTALHRPPTSLGCMALHGRVAARTLPPILQPTALPFYCELYLTETITTNLEVHGPPCTSCTVLHGLEDQLCCIELHRMSDVDLCTDLRATHAAALQASRGCTSLHDSFLNLHCDSLERASCWHGTL